MRAAMIMGMASRITIGHCCSRLLKLKANVGISKAVNGEGAPMGPIAAPKSEASDTTGRYEWLSDNPDTWEGIQARASDSSARASSENHKHACVPVLN